jgi:hypothetical protein
MLSLRTYALVMESRRPLADLTADELRQRSRDYCDMAATATTADVRDALIRLAVRFAILAVTRDAISKAREPKNPRPAAGDGTDAP